ncbi:primary-amine oxidase [Amycolatopsis magusensis]|uniref:Amine oxidase n=1 Tax=Amycolatopsis magusensis TaxID=882444 RepID=A0ABS4Q2B0_9PSEU|nr:primary-amine oxidase [Amycolatopsis magusensis]MBP2185822.1 primary-amine oxidase [Amycolatopsis magusensis]
MTTHPLSALTADEITVARRVLTDAGHVGTETRFAYVGLDEPDKRERAPERRARVLLLDLGTGAANDARVSLTTEAVEITPVDGAIGQLPILDEEFGIIGPILNESPDWLAALEKRGVEPDSVIYAPLSAGNYGYLDEEGKRLLRVLAFLQDHPQDHCWAHPVDGLCAYVDLVARKLHKLIDHRVHEVPEESGNYQDPEVAGPPLEGLKPIEIRQPEGPSFRFDGDELRWANWSLHVGFDTREGLVLREIAFSGRPIVQRASIAEMVVPYADPSPVRFWQNYFDTGEYLFGRYANSLKLGCDCLGEITYLDVTVADELGNPRVIENAICVHEEDFGTLWKHTDLFTGIAETRRQRRLVISFFTTVGNYDYGFYWYLYLDGTIECEVKLTGFLFTSAYPEEGSVFATQVAPGLGAPYHQHLFCARLDLTIDGDLNAVDEIDVVARPMDEANPHGNAFTTKTTRLTNETARDAAPNRVWRIVNPDKLNRMGEPVGYTLSVQQSPTLLADPKSVIASRAAFATKHLWVTRYAPGERYAAGDFVNQSPGGEGLPAYTAAGRDIDGQDIVLWHTFGPTHVPRLEDWPIMPVDHAKFTLKPTGFFDRNPTLNVP